MKKEKFLNKIKENYKAAMQDCQLPTGALAILNPAEFYAYCLYQENKRLLKNQKDLILKERLGAIEDYIESIKLGKG